MLIECPLLVLQEEEVPWVGLTLEEAEERQLRMEKEEALRTRRPLKEVYCEQLIESLKSKYLFKTITLIDIISDHPSCKVMCTMSI